MALDFRSPTTSKLTSVFTTHGTLRSYALWVYRINTGGGGLGRMFEKRVAGAQVEVLGILTGGTYNFNRAWSGAAAVNWNFADGGAPTLNQWHHLGVTYDDGNVANDAVMYLNGVSQTVVENSGPPSGSLNTNSDAYVIGNRGNDNARNWGGYLAEFAIWDRILSAGEAAALGAGYSPLFFPDGLVEYLPMLRDTISRKLAAPTLSGGAVVEHPRIIYPAGPLIVPATAAGFNPAWARNANTIVGAAA